MRTRVVGTLVGGALVAGIGVGMAPSASATRYEDIPYDSLWACWNAPRPARDAWLVRDCYYNFALYGGRYTKTWAFRDGGGSF